MHESLRFRVHGGIWPRVGLGDFGGLFTSVYTTGLPSGILTWAAPVVMQVAPPDSQEVHLVRKVWRMSLWICNRKMYMFTCSLGKVKFSSLMLKVFRIKPLLVLSLPNLGRMGLMHIHFVNVCGVVFLSRSRYTQSSHLLSTEPLQHSNPIL